jgi:hypothetical protein
VLRALRGEGTLVLWAFLGALLTFVVAPAAHLNGHQADHVHDADGSVRRVAPAGERADRQSNDVSVDRPDERHGVGGALHFGLTLTEAPPVATLPPAVPFLTAPPAPLLTLVLDRTPFGRVRPRGPPPV